MAEHLILVRKGQVLPRVTTIQVLMRRHQPQSLITCDGDFGSKTHAAVQKFQKHHKISDDGVVGNETWGKLEKASGLTIIDVVDNTEFTEVEAGDIRKAGGNPIEVFGMSNGIAVVMSMISGRAGKGNVALLRLHGHGGSGTQGITSGTIDGIPHMADLSVDNFTQLQSDLATIKHIFVEFGSVELHGCSVGSGGRGKDLLNKLAVTWGVPVTAGIKTQFAGGAKTFQFEGPTVTGFPAGGSLKGWSAHQQTIHGMVSLPT
jgi:hypothetical protein